MISKTDLKNLYEWAKDKDFPVRKTPTTTGYCNKEIFSFPLKFGRKKLTVRESMMPVEISDILKDEEILYTVYSIFQGGTILKPHRDQTYISFLTKEYRYR